MTVKVVVPLEDSSGADKPSFQCFIKRLFKFLTAPCTHNNHLSVQQQDLPHPVPENECQM